MAVATVILSVKDAASGALDDISDAARDTSAALDKTGSAATKSSASLSRMGDVAGNVGSSAGKLAGGLDLLAPGLGNVARGIADMADIGEVAAGALGGIQGGLSLVAVAAGALALVLGTLAAAYAVVGNATSSDTQLLFDQALAFVEADTGATKLAATLGQLAVAQQAAGVVFRDTATQIALLTGAVSDYEVAGAKAAESVRAGSRAQVLALAAQLAIQTEALAKAKLVASSNLSTATERAAAILQEAEYSAAVKRTSTALEALKSTTDAQAGALEGLIVQQGREKEAQSQAADASAKAAKARAAQAAQAAAAAEAQRKAGEVVTEQKKAAMTESDNFGEATFGATNSKQIEFLTDFYQRLSEARQQSDLQDLLIDLAAATDTYRLSTEQATAALSDLNTEQGKVSTAPAAAGGTAIGAALTTATPSSASSDMAGQLQAGSAAAGSLSGLTQLDPSGISGAVVAGMKSVIDISSGGGITGDITALLEGFSAALPELVPALVDFIGKLLTELIPGLADGLVGLVASLGEALPDLITNVIGSIDDQLVNMITLIPRLLYEVFSMLLSPRFWMDMGKAFVDALLDLLNPFDKKDGTGLFQSKGATSKTGAALQDLFNGKKDTSNLTITGAIAADLRDFTRKQAEYMARAKAERAS
jgi:hypothetical protein